MIPYFHVLIDGGRGYTHKTLKKTKDNFKKYFNEIHLLELPGKKGEPREVRKEIRLQDRLDAWNDFSDDLGGRQVNVGHSLGGLELQLKETQHSKHTYANVFVSPNVQNIMHTYLDFFRTIKKAKWTAVKALFNPYGQLSRDFVRKALYSDDIECKDLDFLMNNLVEEPKRVIKEALSGEVVEVDYKKLGQNYAIIFNSSNDWVVSPRTGEFLHDKINSQRKEKILVEQIVVDNLSHCGLIENPSLPKFIFGFLDFVLRNHF